MSKYDGDMPDSFFRVLSAAEEVMFRQEARNIWNMPEYGRACVPDDFGMYHPVVRDEWRKLDFAFDVANEINGWNRTNV
jgi:hypothetical protein